MPTTPMDYVLLVCIVANVAQAVIYHRLEGRFQKMFWGLAAFCAAVYAL